MRGILIIIVSILSFGGALGAQERIKEGKTSYNSVFDLLRSEPGVVVGTDSGNGTMPRVIIRGVGTNSDQTQPLFVVDGIITDNVTYLRPEDIYFVEVLKDGTSSIYGMEGQNGVIIFRTNAAMEAKKLAEAPRRRNSPAPGKTGNIR
ncbi:MAG: TonB-dependent receptor plug domain-containing protein [Bacteroidales bacterium]|nr:TonB-dependent receptor plug domain-containing protein [Bacteroidales bacterium]